MTSFTSLLSSIGGGPPSAPRTNAKPSSKPANAAGTQASSNGAKLPTNNVAAGMKRKAEDEAGPPSAKVVKTEIKVPVPLPRQTNTQTAQKPTSSAAASSTPYRGTARGSGVASSTVVTKSAPRPTSSASVPTQPAATPANPNASAKPKRGFASLMEKAKAATEAAKAVNPSTIKHKPVEKTTRRDRQRMREEAAKQKASGKSNKLAGSHQSRSGTPADAKTSAQKKPLQSGYAGTMRKPVERQQSTYRGTMNKAPAESSSARPTKKKNLAQDKYGGYASWSDLDDAEDEEEDYESDASSDMMDAGFDDMENEERRALQAAKREDQEALQEEERHKQEKLERKKKLLALSKNAASKRRY